MSKGRIVRPNADWVAVVEAAYAPVREDRAWAEGVLASANRVLASPVMSGAIAIEHAPDLSSARPIISAGQSIEHLAKGQSDAFALVGREVIREFYYPPALVTTHLAIQKRLPDSAKGMLHELRATYGVADMIGLVTHPEPGTPTVFFAGVPYPVELTAHETSLLSRIALHIEAATRLRLRPEVVKGVLSPEGKILHLEKASVSTEALSRHARQIERARTRKQRRSPEALDPWPLLVEGRVSLVERIEGSKRFYLVVENSPARQPMRALTKAELDVLSHAARGMPAKLVGYALGVSSPTVSARLASAASKLGLATRIELVRLAAMLTRDPRARFEKIALTSAERDVLELLNQGLSNREIAAIRNRSVRTIANQVAQLLRKTNSATRRALVTRTSD